MIKFHHPKRETGKKIDELYQEFRDKPLGSASIGQAHYAVLKDGTKVVTKVQRPLIADMMRKDFVLLKKLGRVINTISDTDDDSEQMIDLVSVIDELEKVTNEELDFRIEAENTRFFKENCIADEEKITCPSVIDELTTERIFTMTFVDGYSIAKKERLMDDGYDPEEIGAVIPDNYLHQVLDVGTFHADPHQGNLMVSHGKPVWIDFGMIGRITEADVNMLQALILSLIDRDLDTLVNTIMSIGATSPKTDRNKLLEDADMMFDKYMNVTNLQELDLSTLLEEVTSLADKHHISLPGKYTMLVRSIATIEGVIEQLCPELNLFQMITDKLMERVKKNLDVKQELISAGKDVLGVSKKVAKMPELAYDALNGMVKGRMKMNLELISYDEILNKVNETTRNVILALFACVLFIGSCVLSSTDLKPQTPDGQPLIAAVGMVFSIALAIYTVRRMSKKK
ncbi:MAG: AarF/ABC1/UbiB kinase family protein [Clostridia bacterium]|nr:AarF/ABC1/UbiB kinase family protein [Clostridia bacterium]